MSIFNQASALHGITITLYTESETYVDAFNRPHIVEEPVEVANVLVGSPTSEEVLDTLNLTGRRVVYILGIPKGDTNDWTDKKVSFFGQTFKTIGSPIQGIDTLIPMEWNKKVKCEAINDV